MSEDELRAEAVRLLDTFGDWPGGRAWWADAGWPDPPCELMEAVKLEMIRRTWAANPTPPGAAYFHFTPHEPGADERAPTRLTGAPVSRPDVIVPRDRQRFSVECGDARGRSHPGMCRPRTSNRSEQIQRRDLHLPRCFALVFIHWQQARPRASGTPVAVDRRVWRRSLCGRSWVGSPCSKTGTTSRQRVRNCFGRVGPKRATSASGSAGLRGSPALRTHSLSLTAGPPPARSRGARSTSETPTSQASPPPTASQGLTR